MERGFIPFGTFKEDLFDTELIVKHFLGAWQILSIVCPVSALKGVFSLGVCQEKLGFGMKLQDSG